MIKRHALSLLAAVAVFASVRGAEAQTAPNNQYIATDKRGDLKVYDDAAGFGNPRQWAFSTDAGLQISRSTISGQDVASTQLILQPAFDYFVIKNLSVGGAVGLNYNKQGSQKGTKLTIGPRVGYNFELSRMLSVWPKLGFSFSHTNSDGADDEANALALNLFAPVMLHPAPHFFVGFGPFLDADLSGDSRSTTWGFKLTLGGWIQQKARG
ncbi:MAG TPA: hypothetical protein VFX59_21225 [Polyangiales bacterium]|nr:hypothetical protein [Polyangiales bacterium]